MTQFLAILILFIIFAIGDIISSYSKAYLSMVLVSALILMVGFWSGLPTTLFKDSGLPVLHALIGFFIVHLGGTIKLKTLLSDWRVLAVSVVTCSGIAIGSFFIGQLFMDRAYALAAAPIAAGGNVAYLIMKETYTKLGRPDVETFAVLILVFQMLPGILVASILSKKIGVDLHEQYLAGKLVTNSSSDTKEVIPRKKLIPPLPQKFQTGNVIFAKIALLAYIGFLISNATGVHQLIFQLFLGFIATEIGFLEEQALVTANSYTFIVAIALVAIFSGLAGSTLPMVISMIIPMIIILGIGLVAMFVLGILMAKILKMDWKIAVVVASTAYYGLINGYVIASEVARSIGQSPEEQKAMLEYFSPKLVIGSVFSVFIVSVVAASAMAGWF